jgi:hypothetical protein
LFVVQILVDFYFTDDTTTNYPLLSSISTSTSTNFLSGTKNPSCSSLVTVEVRKPSVISFYDFEMARSISICSSSGGGNGECILLEANRIRLMAIKAWSSPCTLDSGVVLNVPFEYEQKSCPLRLYGVSLSGKQFGIVGQRGFCLFNQLTNRWRMFGNVQEEQDMRVHAIVWLNEEIICVLCSKISENHTFFHLQAYPRNHLDQEALLVDLPLVRCEEEFEEKEKQNNNYQENKVYGDLYAMEMSQNVLFCLSTKGISCFTVVVNGTLKEKNIKVEFSWRRQLKFPSVLMNSIISNGLCDVQFSYFAMIPRLLHQQQPQASEIIDQEDDSSWFSMSNLMNWMVGGEIPDQYKPEDVLPRILLLDRIGNVWLWDPETRQIRLLAKNISKITHMNMNTMLKQQQHDCINGSTPKWPIACRLLYGFYGPEGMRLWLPLLDGVNFTSLFENQQQALEALEVFLSIHDTVRAKTFDIEFGSSNSNKNSSISNKNSSNSNNNSSNSSSSQKNKNVTAMELYCQILEEYGIKLDDPSVISTSSTPSTSYNNIGLYTTSLDHFLSKDHMFRFDSEAKVLGIDKCFGLLVGISQDVYNVPISGVEAEPSPTTTTTMTTTTSTSTSSTSSSFLPCYDLFCRVQPFFHTLLCFLIGINQMEWAKQILFVLRQEIALATLTQEMVLHSMVENVFENKIPSKMVEKTIQLLKIFKEYGEIVSNVARKGEPNRLRILFPLAGEPMELSSTSRITYSGKFFIDS